MKTLSEFDREQFRMEKVRENKARRDADRQGLRLVKSRSRDPDAMDYGLYALLDKKDGGAVNPAIAKRWVHSWSLQEVEDFLEMWADGVSDIDRPKIRDAQERRREEVRMAKEREREEAKWATREAREREREEVRTRGIHMQKPA